ncbi:hypothetical protein GN244_ATG09016 [Phytophthora infestans]|uniref:Uncharacterized protein n=1 Tax=Phytophthora infestans TaxID=4787 RepID=A0A833T891_PHYIN|nr:hypothetical protein GN244_ATG09016 [Phytophthora infestans]
MAPIINEPDDDLAAGICRDNLIEMLERDFRRRPNATVAGPVHPEEMQAASPATTLPAVRYGRHTR